MTILQHGVDPATAPHPAVLDSVRHAVEQVIQRATSGFPTGTRPVHRITPLGNAGITVADDDTYADRLAGLSEHRPPVLSFARESLRHLPAPDPTNDQSPD